MEANIQQDYFSTVLPDAIEPITAPQPSHGRPLRTAVVRPLRRDSVRPILLSAGASDYLLDVFPRERIFARSLSAGLALVIIFSSMLTTVWCCSPLPGAVVFNSPSLNAAIRQVDQQSLPVVANITTRLNSMATSTSIRGWITAPPNGSIFSAAELSMLAACLIVIFIIGRRIAGSFGGLLALLLASTSMIALAESTAIGVSPVSVVANGFGLVGLLSLATGWRRRGLVAAVAASLLVGMSASLDHAEALLIVPLLIVGIDLPWRWSWLMPLSAVLPVAVLFACDQHFSGVRPSLQIHAIGIADAQQAFNISVGDLQKFPSAAMLLPLAIIGFGLLMKADKRWGSLLLGWCCPAIGLLAIHGNAVNQRMIVLALPPMILVTTWLISRSTIAGGILVTMMSVMWLHAPPPPLNPAATPIPTQKLLSPNDVSGSGFVVL